MRVTRRISGVLGALGVGLLTGLLTRVLNLQVLPLLLVLALALIVAVCLIVPWALRPSDPGPDEASEQRPLVTTESIRLPEPMFITTGWREKGRFTSVGDEIPGPRVADGFSADGSTFERHVSIVIPDDTQQ